MTTIESINRTRELAGMKPLAEEVLVKSTLLEVSLEKAKAAGTAQMHDTSNVIAVQEGLSRVANSIKSLNLEPKLPVGWPSAVSILPPDLAKKLKAVLAAEADAREVSDYMKAYWKASAAAKSKK